MDLENIYNSNKDSIIGFNHDNFNNYRKKLIDNFNLDNKILKKCIINICYFENIHLEATN